MLKWRGKSWCWRKRVHEQVPKVSHEQELIHLNAISQQITLDSSIILARAFTHCSRKFCWRPQQADAGIATHTNNELASHKLVVHIRHSHLKQGYQCSAYA